ncbi:MAG: hypothetical protein NTW19_04375 [Planctomycetota bacterium]|nr:hypothetical protein [Planctomycetota bacterium]
MPPITSPRSLGLALVGALVSLAPIAPAVIPAAAQAQAPLPPAPAKPAADLPVVDLPVTKAVLFSSGVGYFEHTGEVDGGAVLRLRFKTDQINDVLKSMIVLDEGGGAVTSVNYPSNDPVARSLKGFGVDLSGSPSFPDLLRQLRGVQVIVTTTEKIAGSIVSLDEQTKVVGQPPAQVTEFILTLATETGMRSIPLSTVSNIALADNHLQQELNKALALLATSRDTESKPVEIRFAGQGKRQVRVGYLIETPVWKTSYRLDLSAQKPLIQGWSLVENTSESDWNAVQLSLVSGRPISFTMDLYTPLYMPRPNVKPPMYASLQPRIYEEGIALAEKAEALGADNANGAPMMAGKAAARREMNAPGRPAAPAPMMAARGGMMMDDLSSAASSGVALQQAAQQIASGVSVGELFKYTLASKVDMPRRRSAMLPIISSPITAEKVSIYNQGVMPNRPLNGVYLTNDTNLKMLGGPITVFDGGTYAGDAMIDFLSPGDKRLISYAMDLAVTVDPSVSNESQLTGGKIIRGVLQIVRLNVFSQTYLIKNKADVAKKIVVEHPFINGRNLLEPAKFEEKTPQLYRFLVNVEASKTASFVVKEQQPVSEAIALLDYPVDALVVFSKAGQIDPAVRDALAKVIAVKRQQVELQIQQQNLRNELAQITQEQDRLRKNIETSGRDSTLGKRYLEKLNTQETRIEEIQKAVADLQKQIDAKRQELAEMLTNLNVG